MIKIHHKVYEGQDPRTYNFVTYILFHLFVFLFLYIEGTSEFKFANNFQNQNFMLSVKW